jgi:hydroxymethylpyrimidine pyrophosphatase-like HAD family hydrolase
MRYSALASDFDGTLATDGRVPAELITGLRRVRESGRRTLLVTGRMLSDLLATFHDVDVFDRVVAEDGAIIFTPADGSVEELAPPPPARFISELESRGVSPIFTGRVIVATLSPSEAVVEAVIGDLGLDLRVSLNREAVMILPAGVGKGSGLRVALGGLGLEPGDAVGIGDAQNDLDFLEICGYSVAVGNALPGVIESSDHVTVGSNSEGVAELIDALLLDDLAGWSGRSMIEAE